MTWMRMETAPKDGALILAANFDTAYQNPVVVYYDPGSCIFDIMPHWRTSMHEVLGDPGVTHWMPLPSQPEISTNNSAVT